MRRFFVILGVGIVFVAALIAYLPRVSCLGFHLGLVEPTVGSKIVLLAPGWCPGPREDSLILRILGARAANPGRVFYRPNAFLPGYKKMIAMGPFEGGDASKIKNETVETKQFRWGSALIMRPGSTGAVYTAVIPQHSLIMALGDTQFIDDIVDIKDEPESLR